MPIRDKKVVFAFNRSGLDMGDREVVLTAVKYNGLHLKYAEESLKGDREVVLTAVKQNGNALKYAAGSLKGNHEMVLTAVKQNGNALKYAAGSQMRNREVVLTAVKQNGQLLECAAESLKGDREVVLTAVSQNGEYLKYAAESLRGDREVVLTAIRSSSESIQYALNGLSQNPECLAAAGRLVSQHTYARSEEIIISEKFTLAAETSQWPANVIEGLRCHSFFKDFRIYDPNIFCKDSCDPDFTNFDHPCRGEIDLCEMPPNVDEDGRPTHKSCWRFSFRWHEEKCAKSRGFMFQLMGGDWGVNSGRLEFRWDLGAGQVIETDMAKRANLKVFRVKQALSPEWPFYPTTFSKKHGDMMADAVKLWYASGCSDMTLQVIALNTEVELTHHFEAIARGCKQRFSYSDNGDSCSFCQNPE